MSNNKILNLNYPLSIKSDFIAALYPSVENELKTIIEKSGQKKVLIAQLKQRLDYLENYKEKCVLHNQWFENYKKNDWLYCLKVKNRDVNLRIYFSFIADYAIFLHAFTETAKADLEKAKKKAAERYDLIKNNKENELWIR